MKKLYVKATQDEYELPEAVADTPTELAEMLGTTRNVVESSISHKRRGWYRMDFEELDDEI